MTATAWTSNLDTFNRDDDDAQEMAIIAVAYVLVNAVKRALKGGYTSGAFVTGETINSVTRGTPFREGMGWSIEVGTNLMRALFWEIGHNNLFTGKYEREERWRPAFMDSRDAMAATYAREYQRRMAKWRAR